MADQSALISEFSECLKTMSYCRAGWDYELSPEVKRREDKQCADALAKAREIWRENTAIRADLRAAFKAASPLATMEEIERNS